MIIEAIQRWKLPYVISTSHIQTLLTCWRNVPYQIFCRLYPAGHETNVALKLHPLTVTCIRDWQHAHLSAWVSMLSVSDAYPHWANYAHELLYIFDHMPRLLFLSLIVFVQLLRQGGIYFFRIPADIKYVRVVQWRLIEYAQLLSCAVSLGKELYNTNSPSVSLLTTILDYFHTCAYMCRVH